MNKRFCPLVVALEFFSDFLTKMLRNFCQCFGLPCAGPKKSWRTFRIFLNFFLGLGAEETEEASEQVAGGGILVFIENTRKGGGIGGGGVGAQALRGCLKEGGGELNIGAKVFFFFRG